MERVINNLILSIVTLVIVSGCAEAEVKVVRDGAKDYAKAEKLVAEKKYDEALEIVELYGDKLVDESSWLDLLIEIHESQGDLGELITLYRHFPEAFLKYEKASTTVAGALLAARAPNEFVELREQWKGKETLHHHWFAADADYLVIQGRKDDAIRMLKNRKFEGEQDTGRLIRLAILEGQNSSRAAWDHLSKAQEQDSENPDIRIMRGRLLENLGRYQLAQMEYTAAARLAPERPELRDVLAEFHIRRRQYVQALQLWAYGLKEPSNQKIWIKALFWQSVTQVVNPSLFTDNPIPEGKHKAFIQYLIDIPNDRYWDQTAFEELPNHKELFQTQQITYWLRLMQALKDGNEERALSLLEFNHFSPQSWCPELELNLRRVLLYRLTGNFNLDGEAITNQETIVDAYAKDVPKHQFFVQLDEQHQALRKNSTHRLDADIQEFLTGREAIAATFMAAGWLEAGLQLHKVAVIPENYPEWVSYALAQCYRYNRGTITALDFIKKQRPTPALNMLEGELLVIAGSPDSGISKLAEAAKTPGPIGTQSAWRLVLVYLNEKRFDEARGALKKYPNLTKTMTGKELRARVELLGGNKNEATRLYSTIAKDSTEAQSYLARLAYENEDWGRARELTEKLLRKHPNSYPLRANLARIMEKMEGVKN